MQKKKLDDVHFDRKIHIPTTGSHLNTANKDNSNNDGAKKSNFNQTSLNLPVDIMLLSLVIVAVDITSFTVACFSLVALLCFFSSIKRKKQKSQTKKKKNTLDKEGD